MAPTTEFLIWLDLNRLGWLICLVALLCCDGVAIAFFCDYSVPRRLVFFLLFFPFFVALQLRLFFRFISIACDRSETIPTPRSYRSVYDNCLDCWHFPFYKSLATRGAGEHGSRWMIRYVSRYVNVPRPVRCGSFSLFSPRVDLRYTGLK